MGCYKRGKRACVKLAIQGIAQGVIVESRYDEGFLQGYDRGNLGRLPPFA